MSSTTLAIIEQRWTARLGGRHEEYHQLDKLRRQALRRDKAERVDRVARDAEEYPQTLSDRQHEGCFLELTTVDTILTEHLCSYHLQKLASFSQTENLSFKDGRLF